MYIKTEVEPCDYVTPVRVIHRIELQIMRLVLFSSVSIGVSLYDENDYIIDNRQITIQGEEYNNWANDDNYLLDLVLVKLGLIKKSI